MNEAHNPALPRFKDIDHVSEVCMASARKVIAREKARKAKKESESSKKAEKKPAKKKSGD